MSGKRKRGGPSLADRRFDTPEASELFFDLRDTDPRYRASTDSAVRLPPNGQSVSSTPHSGGAVVKAFAHGLMYADEKSQAAGMFLLFAPWLGYLFFQLATVHAPTLEPASVPFALALCWFAVIASALMLRADLTGYRYNGVLLDRSARKVHLFIDETPWLVNFYPFRIGLWPLVGGGKAAVHSFDWDCVRAEIDTQRVFTGTVGRTDAVLRCVVTDRPGSDTLVATFGLGFAGSARRVQRLLDTWEHARRFMQHEGPLFADASDKPHPTLALPLGWWEMFAPSNLLGADVINAFKTTRNPFWLVVWVVGIALIPVLMVFFGVLGIAQTIAWLFKSNPKWPAEVIASVGGKALRGKELDAWRQVVPQKDQGLGTQPPSPTITT